MSERIKRLKLEDLLADNPQGFTGRIFWFHDISDEQALSDRVVVGFYDSEKQVTYTGTVLLQTEGVSTMSPEAYADDLKAFKEHLNSVWNDGEPSATVLPAPDASKFPLLVPVKA